MPIIRSILDTDLYKLTMSKAVLRLRQQRLPVVYKFIDRSKTGLFNNGFMEGFYTELENMSQLALTRDEASWLKSDVKFLGDEYVEWLRNFRPNPDRIKAKLVDGDLELSIEDGATWEKDIWWEVSLMAMISELYFIHCDTNWTFDRQFQISQIHNKAHILKKCFFSDFGTRRRRCYEIQDLIVGELKQYPNFNGTSNVHLAHKHGVKPIGTMAHEWIMGISALESLRHANRYALRLWSECFDGNLGIALTDTFGTDAFWPDFDGSLARLFDGVRHDSDDPYAFGYKTIEHYKNMNIYPMSRMIVFSDALDPPKAAALEEEFRGKIRTGFGIGTNFTNDFPGSKPLNMVIKLYEINGIPVVKLSDSPTKAIGDKDALRVAKWVFNGTPLDA